MVGVMDTKRLTVFIPAVEDFRVFKDGLLRKLAGVTLVQRAIDKAIALGVTKNNI